MVNQNQAGGKNRDEDYHHKSNDPQQKQFWGFQSQTQSLQIIFYAAEQVHTFISLYQSVIKRDRSKKINMAE
jgi:hypothetical protein